MCKQQLSGSHLEWARRNDSLADFKMRLQNRCFMNLSSSIGNFHSPLPANPEQEEVEQENLLTGPNFL
jgi:hypothetical protein